ncbi:MAG: hypothetical protein FWG77_05625 [Treponema sp.]|nr:hypothetical protein [Treponema sp.]
MAVYCQIPMINDSNTDSIDRAPDCFRCIHFKITWEASFPRACVLFGIKCRNLPSMEVFLSTGKHCFSFINKVEHEEPKL